MDKCVKHKQLVLDVTLFNDFQISCKNQIIEESDIRSEMVTKLLAYIVCHRSSCVSVQTLSEVLWGDEGCENPIGALKNLMYRLRNFLKHYIGDYNFILTGHGTYAWNNEDIQLNVDSEEFERLCKKAEKEGDIKKRISYALQADTLYKKFLPQYMSEYWVMSLSVYYHSLFLSTIKKLAQDLKSEERYYEMEEVTYDGIMVDELDEDFHYYYIEALLFQNKTNVAREHYRKTCELLYDTLGVRPSEKLRGLYGDMMKQQHKTELDITKIKKELLEKGENRKGAFMCEYGVFQKNYELELRRARRQNSNIYLGLITVSSKHKLQEDSQLYLNTISMGMKQLQNVLMESLRAGDVLTRYSASQFMLMLPACNHDDAIMVMNRVINQFLQQKHKEKVQLGYCLNEIDI